jgi:hypothetical protein
MTELSGGFLPNFPRSDTDRTFAVLSPVTLQIDSLANHADN